jgi:hypothetical protein
MGEMGGTGDIPGIPIGGNGSIPCWDGRGIIAGKEKSNRWLRGRLLCTGAGQGGHTGIIILGGPAIATDPGEGPCCCCIADPGPAELTGAEVILNHTPSLLNQALGAIDQDFPIFPRKTTGVA